MLFIESSYFTKTLPEYINDGSYRGLQERLIAYPTLGQVMPGCGGLRKVRHGNPKRGKGRRGGLRIIYLYFPEMSWIFLLDIYGKDEKEDLNANEKNILARLAGRIKNEARLRSLKRSR